MRDSGHKVKPPALLAFELPPPEPALPEPQHMQLAIVYEDRDLLVIDKPAGLVVHPGAGHGSGTLVNALIAHCGDSLSGIGGVRRPGIVHRLDKETSGLLVVAKNDASHRALSEQFSAHGRDGKLQRSYVAIVWGKPDKDQGIISAALARSMSNRQKMAVSSSPSARQAITHYELLEVFGKPPRASLLRCHLETGRTHQIRVHFSHIGHPLLGDPVYGVGFRSSSRTLSPAAQQALAALDRQALHAETLGFEHPRSGKPMLFKAKMPKDMERLVAALRSPHI